ncbi:hypothetical protein BP6252_06748 [Coleophoma cylindrospora]|uniref:Knr4/Smi1-like domain-containing protein n=1 Tax=Coleophoma cylindrospora TaxID=1849047 RepID=A0A3D8RG49_9HELO|nr:hypothetical protein BP6252_06748 [Coleophoma cylindrospora]
MQSQRDVILRTHEMSADIGPGKVINFSKFKSATAHELAPLRDVNNIIRSVTVKQSGYCRSLLSKAGENHNSVGMFLQGFLEDDILAECSTGAVVANASFKAVELAMLGLPDEANAIFALLHPTGCLRYSSPMEFFFAASGTRRPDGTEPLNDQKLAPLEQQALESFGHLPRDINFANIDETSYEKISSFVNDLDSRDSPYKDARTGLQAMLMSAGVTALLAMANVLGHEDQASNMMNRIARRIHANQQSAYLSVVRSVWRPYFLSGWLRDKLGITVAELQQYAEFVLQTTKTRLENGPRRIDDFYADKDIPQLLDELSQNTVTSPDYTSDVYYDDHVGDTAPISVLGLPATEEHITSSETRIGHKFPEDLKNFLRITNGCLRVKVGSPPGQMFQRRLVSLGFMAWEDSCFMASPTFYLLPDIRKVDFDWPEFETGAVAMYEHSGQCTQHVWMVPEALVQTAKQRVQDVYERANDETKAIIDHEINFRFGSREAFNEMTVCFYQQYWGEADGEAFPSFRSFLNRVVYESRTMQQRSPLKLPFE